MSSIPLDRLTVDVRAQTSTAVDRPSSASMVLLGPARRFAAAAEAWTFRYPLPVLFEREDDGTMIAVDQLFGNYGHGDSRDAAVADLVLVLTEYYQLLHGADDTASREMFEDLQTYLERIE